MRRLYSEERRVEHRRPPLERAGTAPEEYDFQANFETEWRRRNFRKAARPSSVDGPRAELNLQPLVQDDCSASCPPTVPATPTRSPRAPVPGPQFAPPPPPSRIRTPEPLGPPEHFGRRDLFGGSGYAGSVRSGHMEGSSHYVGIDRRGHVTGSGYVGPERRDSFRGLGYIDPEYRDKFGGSGFLGPESRREAFRSSGYLNYRGRDYHTGDGSFAGPALRDRFGGSGIVGPINGGTGFQCECLEERQGWQFEPSGPMDMWCAPCSKKRRPSTRWSTLDLSSKPDRIEASGFLRDFKKERENLRNSHYMSTGGGSRLSVMGSRLNINEQLVQGPPPTTFWDCLVSCHGQMGRHLARKRMEQGLALYNEQKPQEAVKKWQLALSRTQSSADKFATLGYLGQVHIDWGRFREVLDYGFQQLDIANEMNSAVLKSEAYLTLARSHEKLGHLDKALSYCQHSLHYRCDQSKTTGAVHLALGNIYTRFSVFTKALEHYELGLKIAKILKDSLLEFQVYIGLSLAFCYLQDFEKALSFATKGKNMAKNLGTPEMAAKAQRISLIYLATPLRKLSRIQEAKDYCQEAMKSSLAANDFPSYAKCLLILADIHRKCLDVQRAYKYYEGCMKLMRRTEDKFGQLMTLNGVAKVLGLMRKQSRICDCKPLEINNKVVDLASNIGCKLLMRSAHSRLAGLYRTLYDEDNEVLQLRLANCLTEEMELICGVCRISLGDTPGNSLEALPCSHIFHTKCVRDITVMGDRKKKKRICPDCRKSVNSRLMLICNDDVMMDKNNDYNIDTATNNISGLNNSSSINMIPSASSSFLKGGSQFIYDRHCPSESPYECQQQQL